MANNRNDNTGGNSNSSKADDFMKDFESMLDSKIDNKFNKDLKSAFKENREEIFKKNDILKALKDQGKQERKYQDVRTYLLRSIADSTAKGVGAKSEFLGFGFPGGFPGAIFLTAIKTIFGKLAETFKSTMKIAQVGFARGQSVTEALNKTAKDSSNYGYATIAERESIMLAQMEGHLQNATNLTKQTLATSKISGEKIETQIDLLTTLRDLGQADTKSRESSLFRLHEIGRETAHSISTVANIMKESVKSTRKLTTILGAEDAKNVNEAIAALAAGAGNQESAQEMAAELTKMVTNIEQGLRLGFDINKIAGKSANEVQELLKSWAKKGLDFVAPGVDSSDLRGSLINADIYQKMLGTDFVGLNSLIKNMSKRDVVDRGRGSAVVVQKENLALMADASRLFNQINRGTAKMVAGVTNMTTKIAGIEKTIQQPHLEY